MSPSNHADDVRASGLDLEEIVIPMVDVSTLAAAHADGALVIDVREPGEYSGGHVPGAHLIPLGRVAAGVRDLPRDRPVYVICASGNRSGQAVGMLRQGGVDAVSVVGGTTAWISGGHPVVRGATRG